MKASNQCCYSYERRKSQVESGEPTDSQSIAQRLERLKVPGAKIAVINDGVVEWSQGYGTLSDADPYLQAASISKTIAALTILAYINRHPHVIGLDTDVSTIIHKDMWKHIDPHNLSAHEKVTLRRLMSHSGGTNLQAGFDGYSRLNKDLYIPHCTKEIIMGKGNTPPIQIINVPGSVCQYSGGSLTLARYVLEVATGEHFEELVNELVFKPLKMEMSGYAPLPELTATGHDERGIPVPGRWHHFPETASAGLWSTAEDVAKAAAGLQQALRGDGGGIISQELAWQMVTPVCGDAGLGTFVINMPSTKYFLHTGWTMGFKCVMMADVSSVGAVIMTNGSNGDVLYKELLPLIAKVYDWPDRQSNSLISW